MSNITNSVTAISTHGPPTTYEIIVYWGLVTFVVHEIIWLTLLSPYYFIEKYGMYRDRKVQKEKQNSFEEFQRVFFKIIKEHFKKMLPFTLLTSATGISMTFIDLYWEPFPSIPKAILQLVCMRFCYVVSFYWIHRFLHTPYMYKNFHKVHHERVSPFALDGEHAHPLESAIGFQGPFFIGMAVVGLSPLGKIHQFLVYVYLFYTLYRSYEGHSGYVLPWHIGGYAVWHDAHHSGFHYNFGEPWIDKLFGTDMHKYKQKAH